MKIDPIEDKKMIEEGHKIYQKTMEDVQKGGEPLILTVTDQSAFRCERKFDQDVQKFLCKKGVYEKMEEDLKIEWKKNHPESRVK